MAHSTREQPRERDHTFWATHFHQRGYKRPGQQHQHRGFYHGRSGGVSSQDNYLIPNNNNPGKTLSSVIYNPRPFDHPESERQHLQYLLVEQNRRAVHLFSQIPALDEAHAFGSAHEQRQARRDRAWLLRCIEEAVDREREILVRLSEIQVEILCRERWHMVDQQKAFRRQQHGAWGYGWAGEGDVSDRQRGQSRGASPRHHQDNTGPAIVSSYAQQQHVWSADPHCPSMAAAPLTDVTRWCQDFATPDAVDQSRLRTSGDRTGGHLAYRPRSYSDLSNPSFAKEVEVLQHATSCNPVLPVSRLPDRRRSLPIMHYN
ncbi:hypothetical protein PG991_005891 [Apiospora marii]|uniref:Uncharacterized protein n=1 Tax=Apiospora marii TaxID=335849 RepID=A0ABR1SAG8_9PEZI